MHLDPNFTSIECHGPGFRLIGERADDIQVEHRTTRHETEKEMRTALTLETGPALTLPIRSHRTPQSPAAPEQAPDGNCDNAVEVPVGP